MPAEYCGLGLTSEQLRRHIAWDIGAAEVARRLAGRLDAVAFLGTYSRLFIDLNRPLDVPDSIPAASEGVAIPGNIELTAAEAARRAQAIFAPFHRCVAAHLDQRLAADRPTRLVSIHTLHGVLRGRAAVARGRPILAAAELSGAVLGRLASRDLRIGASTLRHRRAWRKAVPVFPFKLRKFLACQVLEGDIGVSDPLSRRQLGDGDGDWQMT